MYGPGFYLFGGIRALFCAIISPNCVQFFYEKKYLWHDERILLEEPGTLQAQR